MRGTAFWDNVTAEREFDAAGYVLLEDACRTADIIDRLSGMARNQRTDWLKLVEEQSFEDPDAQKIVVNVAPLLGEIRQQRLALRQLMNQLGIAHLATGEQDPESKQSKSFWAEAESQMKE